MKKILLLLVLIGLSSCYEVKYKAKYEAKYVVKELKAEGMFMCAELFYMNRFYIPQKFCKEKEECIEYCNKLIEEEFKHEQ